MRRREAESLVAFVKIDKDGGFFSRRKNQELGFLWILFRVLDRAKVDLEIGGEVFASLDKFEIDAARRIFRWVKETGAMPDLFSGNVLVLPTPVTLACGE